MKNKQRMVVALSLIALGLLSCQKTEGSSVSSLTQTSTTSAVEKCTIRFVNTDFPNQVLEEGSTLSRPQDPEKEGFRFIGWYLDSEYTSPASFPITVTGDLNLYARFRTYREDFLSARKKTIDGSYRYEDLLQVTTTVAGIDGPTAHREGIVHSSTMGELLSLQHYTSSGALLFDGEEYILSKENSSQDIRLNEDGKITDFETTAEKAEIGSTFAKALFRYDDSEIEEVTCVGGRYYLSTTENASSVIASTLSFLGNPLIQSVIEKLPELDCQYQMEVTYSGEFLKSYRYSFVVEVASVATVNFEYSLTFTSYDEEEVVAPSLPGLALNNADKDNWLDSFLAEYESYPSQVLSKDSSTLSLSLQTADETYDVDGRFDMIRVRKENEVYFNNHIDVSSNLDSLYPELEDYEVYRVRLASGEVYSCTNKLFGDEFVPSENRGAIDEFSWRLPSDFFSASSFQAIQEMEENESFFLLADAGIVSFFSFVENQLYLEEESNRIHPFGTYDSDSLSFSENALTIREIDGLREMELTLSGEMKTTIAGNAEVATLELKWTYAEHEPEDYEVPTTTDDIEWR